MAFFSEISEYQSLWKDSLIDELPCSIQSGDSREYSEGYFDYYYGNCECFIPTIIKAEYTFLVEEFSSICNAIIEKNNFLPRTFVMKSLQFLNCNNMLKLLEIITQYKIDGYFTNPIPFFIDNNINQKIISLNFTKDEALRSMKFTPLFSCVLNLSLSKLQKPDIFLPCLCEYKSLRTLLIDCPVLQIDKLVGSFEHLHSLDSLSIIGLRLGGISMDKFRTKLIYLTSLTHLTLSNCSIGSSIKILSESFQYLSNLIFLNLKSNTLRQDVLHLAQNLKFISKLTYLNLQKNYMDYEGIRYLASFINDIPKLITINLSFNNLQTGMPLLKTILIGFTNMKYLNIENNSINPEGYNYLIQSFNSLRKLKILNLGGNTLSKATLMFSDNVKYLVNLRSLYLGKNDLRNNIGILLDNLKHLSLLSDLDIEHNEIPTRFAEIDGYSVLCEFHSLKTLNISYNTLSPLGSRNLVDSLLKSRVISVDLEGSLVDEKELSKLHKMSPNMTINGIQI